MRNAATCQVAYPSPQAFSARLSDRRATRLDVGLPRIWSTSRRYCSLWELQLRLFFLQSWCFTGGAFGTGRAFAFGRSIGRRSLSLANPKGLRQLCFGATHGGQIRVPIFGELVRIERHGIWRQSGLSRERAMWLYVNRGLGNEGGIPKFRFNCPPEIAVLDLVGE